MKKYIMYVLTILLGLFIGVTGTIAIANHDVYYLGAALAGTFGGIISICSMAYINSIAKEDED